MSQAFADAQEYMYEYVQNFLPSYWSIHEVDGQDRVIGPDGPVRYDEDVDNCLICLDHAAAELAKAMEFLRISSVPERK